MRIPGKRRKKVHTGTNLEDRYLLESSSKFEVLEDNDCARKAGPRKGGDLGGLKCQN